MNFKKFLTKVVFVVFIVFLGACANPFEDFEFNGTIDEETVTLQGINDPPFGYNCLLTVKKKDGVVIIYETTIAKKFEVHNITIKKLDQKETRYYVNTEIGRAVLEQGQKQFNEYLKKIKEVKMNRALESLSSILPENLQ